ncbi:tetratricopeptide repeat protein [Anaerobacterium chartisolvens]|uniref:Tetratricopeptide repeat protein n=1 Tax=Anaerobacterium chartisolvens TaxID=1297424 RepID=A0A369BDQ8_9FIRM|nr:tetratricopeptide repeat protein [Anaerobacterium chartisolvens]RCX18738.1 tetratricopeptide repeat protein [Anaerobacterium chartisolvens]
MNRVKKVLINLVLPLIVIFILFTYNLFLGIAGILAYIAYIAYTIRTAIFVFLGNIRYSKGDLKGSSEYLRRAYITGKCKPATTASYAYLLLKSGNIEESEKILERLAASDISSDDKMLVKSNLALVYWKKGMIDEAVDMLTEVFESYRNTTVYGSLGYMLILKGDLERALTFNLEAYDYNGSNHVILDNLGQTYYLRGEYEKSLEIFEKLVSQKPSSPSTYYNYGLLLDKLGRPADALENLKKALGYNITFLSAVTEDEIKDKISDIEKRMG